MSEFLGQVQVKEFIEKNFPIMKLRNDLVGYLEEMSFKKDSENEYKVSVFNIDDLDSEVKIISIHDDINIISCFIRCLFLRDISYHVIIGVGNFIESDRKDFLFTVEKCLVKLKYNDDFSLYDAEFYINRINKA